MSHRKTRLRVLGTKLDYNNNLLNHIKKQNHNSVDPKEELESRVIDWTLNFQGLLVEKQLHFTGS
jgi:hypothetical protein